MRLYIGEAYGRIGIHATDRRTMRCGHRQKIYVSVPMSPDLLPPPEYPGELKEVTALTLPYPIEAVGPPLETSFELFASRNDCSRCQSAAANDGVPFVENA